MKLAYSSWDEREFAAIQRVLESGNFSMGTEVSNFESQFADYFGAKYAVMANSGSSANLLMVASLFFVKDNPLGPGDEVIVPAVSWSTTYFPLQQYGLKLVFVDVDLNTLNYDIESLSRAINKSTRLVVAVNLLGNPNEFSAIAPLIDKHDIRLIEDNCESMGAMYANQYAGTFGVMGSFSTYFSHHISTMEGGLVITDSEELFHIMLSLRAHGWTRNLPDHNYVTGSKSENDFEESFKFVLPGYNLRPIEFMGAVGSAQLEKLPNIIKLRRQNAEYFQEIMGNQTRILIQREIGKSSWFGFSLVVKPDSGLTREDLRKGLIALGIENRPIVAGNFTKNSVCKYFNYEIKGKLVNADLIDSSGLFIGNNGSDLKKWIRGLKKL